MVEKTIYSFGKVKTIQGKETIFCLGEFLKEMQAKKVLLVSDKGIVEAGHVEKACEALKGAGVAWEIYDGVKTDPLDTMVDEALAMCKDSHCDIVVGLGGGSSMDVAKCVSVMMTNEGHIMEYTRINPNKRSFTADRIPLVLIPTTSGTGSELSPFAVITNTAISRKSNVTCEYFLPDVVILDPTLVFTLDKQMTVSSGFDALAHIIDGYTVKAAVLHKNPLVDCIALQAVKMVYQNLGRAYALPNDYEARYMVMMGAHLAGAMLSAGTGASHGLANMLSKYYRVPHGESVGMLLPYVMEHNLIACPSRFAELAEAMGVKKEGMTDIEAGHAAVQAVKQLATSIHLPVLSDYMKQREDIEAFVEESLDNSCNYANVREIDLDAARFIFQGAYDWS